MENKNCKTTLGESYDTDEWMPQYYSSEGRYCSLFTTCAYILTNKQSTSEIWGRNLDLQPPVWSPCLLPALLLSPTPLWFERTSVQSSTSPKHTSHFLVSLYYLWNQVSEMTKRQVVYCGENCTSHVTDWEWACWQWYLQQNWNWN